MGAIPEIITAALEKAFSDWKSTGHVLPPRASPSISISDFSTGSANTTFPDMTVPTTNAYLPNATSYMNIQTPSTSAVDWMSTSQGIGHGMLGLGITAPVTVGDGSGFLGFSAAPTNQFDSFDYNVNQMQVPSEDHNTQWFWEGI